MAAARNGLPSGYDEKFVKAIEEDLQCLICHLALKEPVLTRCGHRFCKTCLQEHFRRQEDKSQPSNCPLDREDLNQERDVFPDKATERKILSLAIKCPNWTGCSWTGELRNKEDHLASCPYKRVACTNENCPMMMLRRNVQQHLTTCQWRVIPCEHCSEPHPKCQMKDHYSQCTKSPTPCPNNCGRSISREKLSEHTTKYCPMTLICCPYEEIGCQRKLSEHTTKYCPMTLICCPYEEIGCQRKVKRREVELHLQSDVKPHLDLAYVKLETRQFIWKVKNVSKLLRDAKDENKLFRESVPFYTDRSESYGYKIKARVYPNGNGNGKGTHLSVYIIVMKGEYDAILPWPFKKKVKFTLIDQQEDSAKRENVTEQLILIPGNNPECFAKPTQKENVGRGYHEFISHEKLHSRRYLLDDTLFLQVEIGPSSR